MQRMAFRLRKAGFEVRVLNYPSTSGSLKNLTDRVALKLPDIGIVDMVGHSLGGLIAKRLMRQLPPERRGRIVQLGSPNFGSEAAEQTRFLAPILGDVLMDLEPNRGDDDQDLEIGAIAGTKPIGLLALTLSGSIPHDGLVTEGTSLLGQSLRRAPEELYGTWPPLRGAQMARCPRRFQR